MPSHRSERAAEESPAAEVHEHPVIDHRPPNAEATAGHGSGSDGTDAMSLHVSKLRGISLDGRIKLTRQGDARGVSLRPIADLRPGGLARIVVEDLLAHEDVGGEGAQFDVTTGAVLAPPAFEPVKTYPLRVDHDNLVVEV